MQDPWAHRTRRGRKKKDEESIAVEERIIEINHPEEGLMVYRPSCSLLPARPLGAPLKEPLVAHAIKKEVEEIDTSQNPSQGFPTTEISRSSISTRKNLEENVDNVVSCSPVFPISHCSTSISDSSVTSLNASSENQPGIPNIRIKTEPEDDYEMHNTQNSVDGIRKQANSESHFMLSVQNNGAAGKEDCTKYLIPSKSKDDNDDSELETCTRSDEKNIEGTRRCLAQWDLKSMFGESSDDELENQPSILQTTESNAIPPAKIINSNDSVTVKRSSKRSFIKYLCLNKEINKPDVEESLNYMKNTYPISKGFSLFSTIVSSRKQIYEPVIVPAQSTIADSSVSADNSRKQIYEPVIEPAQSTIADSSVSADKTHISTETLKKIIEYTSLLNGLSSTHLPQQSNCNDGNLSIATEIGSESFNMNSTADLSSQYNAAESQPGASDQILTTDIFIKSEPVDDYEGPSSASNSSNLLETTGLKRYAEDTASGNEMITKKIKTSRNPPDIAGLLGGDDAQLDNFKINVKTEPAENTVIRQQTPKENKNCNVEVCVLDQAIVNNIKKEPVSPDKKDKSATYDQFATIVSKNKCEKNITSKIDCLSISSNRPSLTCQPDAVERNSISPSKRLPSPARNTINVSKEIPVTQSKFSDNNYQIPVSKKLPSPPRNINSTIKEAPMTEIHNRTGRSIFSGSVAEPSSSKISFSRFVPSLTSLENTMSRPENVTKNDNMNLPSPLIRSNMLALTSQFDSSCITTKENTSQRIPVVDRFLHCKNTQNAESSSNAYSIPVHERTDRENHPLQSIPNYEAPKKKVKLTPQEYLQRQSSIRDPRLKRQQNPSIDSISSNLKDYRDATSCPGEPKSFSNVPFISSYPLNNSSTLQTSPLTVGNRTFQAFGVGENEMLKNTFSDTVVKNVSTLNKSTEPSKDSTFLPHSVQKQKNLPEKHSKSHYKNFFEPRRGSQTALSIQQSDKIGKKFIETKDLHCFIIEWNVNWLYQQDKSKLCPPICDSYLNVKTTYESVLDYYNTYLPLHLLKIWMDMYDSWEKTEKTKNTNMSREFTFERQEERLSFVKITCSMLLSADDKLNWPKREDILICSADGCTKKLFGRVVSITECNYTTPEHLGEWKKVYFDILCAENFDLSPGMPIKLQKLVNIRIALNQNDALRYMNSSMRTVVLKPELHKSQIQTVTVPFISAFQKNNIDPILRSLQSPIHRVTIVSTRNHSESAVAISLIIPRIANTNRMLLVCIKDEKTFLELAALLTTTVYDTVLAIKEEDVPSLPPTQRKFAVKNFSSEALKSCRVALTLMSAMFIGELENRLRKKTVEGDVICIIHEAQFFAETETALPLSCDISHLILFGRNEDNKNVPPKLMRHGFNLSLFHRFLGIK